MKALILAAGLGTRLEPYTHHTPKPLFPINGQPLLDRLIRQLEKSGCTAVTVNTHHLYTRIEEFIASQTYGIQVITRYEPTILGTGGAIKNLSDFWQNEPFLVVNSDVFTTIDFQCVYQSHISGDAPATLVLTDDVRFNTVSIESGKGAEGDAEEHIISFDKDAYPELPKYTFTGIQVIDPKMLDLIPENRFYSSIDAYRTLISQGTPPKAFSGTSAIWKDIGTPNRYREAVLSITTPTAFKNFYGETTPSEFTEVHLDGDGSDRKWYRLSTGSSSLILADHGIRTRLDQEEVDAFIAIGRHLYKKGIAVPQIHAAESFAGLVWEEDLGNTDLQSFGKADQPMEKINSMYRSVIDLLIDFAQTGKEEFDTAWTYQTPSYDRGLILEKECRYFIEAFLNGYLNHQCSYDDFKAEFETLADSALTGSVTGLMHRDFQSRNILIYNNTPYAIDFQGARIGPIQYDLASLLIDPYMNLPLDSQEDLLDYSIARLSQRVRFSKKAFMACYRCCRVTRNLQMLGAFGFLSRKKGKIQFEQYIPTALQSLKENLQKLKNPSLPNLTDYVLNLKLVANPP